MSSLKDTQTAFLKLVTTPKSMKEVLEENPGLDHCIAESNTLSVAQRINIYSTAYYLRILETMKKNYPALHKKMGDDSFDTLIGDYILAHPPQQYSLNYVDEHFVGFIKEPELSNIALFEKKELESFFSKNSKSLTLECLESIPQEHWMGLQLRLIPSCRLVEFDRDQDRHILFFRPELNVHYRVVDDTQAMLIQHLEKEARFDLLCERAAELSSQEDAVNLVGSYLITWVNDGIFESL